MAQEYKELILKDLCARSFYRVKVTVPIMSCIEGQGPNTEPIELVSVNAVYGTCTVGNIHSQISGVRMFDRKGELLCKPYLRPMSSMTEEEKKEFSKFLVKRYCEEDWEGHVSTSYCIEIDNVYTDDEDGIKYPSAFSMDAIDWLNAHHFDYRGLIEKGLALEAPEGMY